MKGYMGTLHFALSLSVNLKLLFKNVFFQSERKSSTCVHMLTN